MVGATPGQVTGASYTTAPRRGQMVVPGVRRKALVWWDENKKQWTGHDNPDFTKEKAPDYKPGKDAKGDDAIAGDQAFHHAS